MAGATKTLVEDNVVPADVLVAIQQLSQELEPLRKHIGAPEANVMNIQISNAAPHDVYFQALSLFQKVNRLSFEITRQRQRPPALPSGISRPVDVLVLVETSHQILDSIMSEFGIVVEHSPVERLATTQPYDVFRAIQVANRQLNLLLRQRFDPSDVFMQVTNAMGYAILLLTPYPDSTPIPDLPPYEPDKSPGDVYFRLLSCLKELQKIYVAAKFPTLTIDASRIKKSQISPSDVFDLASLVVARLDFLYRQMELEDDPRPAFFPGRKYPSDVYQQAGILLNQLRQFVPLAPNHFQSRSHGGAGP